MGFFWLQKKRRRKKILLFLSYNAICLLLSASSKSAVPLSLTGPAGYKHNSDKLIQEHAAKRRKVRDDLQPLKLLLFQHLHFFGRKQPGANMKAYPQRNFQRKAGAPARHNIQGQLGMFPVFVLVAAHVERTAVYLPQQHIAISCTEIALFETHGLGTIAAAATLVKHQGAVRLSQLPDYLPGLIGYTYPFYFHNFLVFRNKKPCPFQGTGLYFCGYSLEEAKLVLVVRNQHVLGLAVMIQHHLMVFPAEA